MATKAVRRDKMLNPESNDVYKLKGKFREPVRCQKCGSVYLKGRWAWSAVEGGVENSLCPACRRMSDRFPAGEVMLKGDFYKAHKAEILQRIRNIEKEEKVRHPLERIMAINQENDQAFLSTTGIHLARRIGNAIADSFSGNLAIKYSPSETHVRVYWER